MDKPVTYNFDFEDLNIDPVKFELLMGYSLPGSCPEPVMEMIRETLLKAPELCEIKGGYLIADPAKADLKNRILFCREQVFHTGKIVTNHLRKIEKAAWFLCTAGEKLPGHSSELMAKGEIMEGYVFDVAGNIIVEAAMDLMQSNISEAMADQGLKITNRYSPGYCEWDINEQKKLFALFPERYLGVQLTRDSLMKPVKTVSGVIGIGKDVKNNPYTCNYCSQQNCLYRDKKGSD